MRTLPFILIVAALLGCSQKRDAVERTIAGVERKVRNFDQDDDGEIESRNEDFSRGTNKVLSVIHKRIGGEMRPVERGFYVAGELRLTEADFDGDGTFERIVIYDRAGNDMEVFTRHADGSVEPVNDLVLEAEREKHKALREYFDSIIGSGKGEDGLTDAWEKLRRNVENAN